MSCSSSMLTSQKVDKLGVFESVCRHVLGEIVRAHIALSRACWAHKAGDQARWGLGMGWWTTTYAMMISSLRISLMALATGSSSDIMVPGKLYMLCLYVYNLYCCHAPASCRVSHVVIAKNRDRKCSCCYRRHGPRTAICNNAELRSKCTPRRWARDTQGMYMVVSMWQATERGADRTWRGRYRCAAANHRCRYCSDVGAVLTLTPTVAHTPTEKYDRPVQFGSKIAYILPTLSRRLLYAGPISCRFRPETDRHLDRRCYHYCRVRRQGLWQCSFRILWKIWLHMISQKATGRVSPRK